jgi:tetratricopeptide (TPR) repeat protein
VSERKAFSLLGGVCLLGLAVSLLLAVFLFLAARSAGIPLASLFASSGGRSSFSRALEEYDARTAEDPAMNFRGRNALLDALEKKASDTGSLLSVLKRRRLLARFAESEREAYLAAYGEAARRARKAFPYSALIGVMAADALIRENPHPLPPENAAELREMTGLISGGSLQDLGLAFSVYAGMMADPSSALELPRGFTTLLASLASGGERERYLVNAAIAALLGGEKAEAETRINAIFESPPLNDDTYRFGAEYYYDYGNYLQAAILFNHFNDDYSVGRQGDAHWLGGFLDSARQLWGTVAFNRADADPERLKIRSRLLYNLASTSADSPEARSALELLFAQNAGEDEGRVFAVIRYSRLAGLQRAIAILEQTDREKESLFDLELVRRRSEQWSVERIVAETWLLVNRHSGDGRIFEWAAWYFDFQHRYDETALLLRDAGINRAEGPWSAIHRASAQLRDGLVDEAEKTLRSIVREDGLPAPGRVRQPLWQASANLGLILDLRGRPSEALDCYETAMGILASTGSLAVRDGGIEAAGPSREMRDASRIQFLIARSLRALGREAESRRVLEYALDLDPENLDASLELRRLAARGF